MRSRLVSLDKFCCWQCHPFGSQQADKLGLSAACADIRGARPSNWASCASLKRRQRAARGATLHVRLAAGCGAAPRRAPDETRAPSPGRIINLLPRRAGCGALETGAQIGRCQRVFSLRHHRPYPYSLPLVRSPAPAPLPHGPTWPVACSNFKRKERVALLLLATEVVFS